MRSIENGQKLASGSFVFVLILLMGFNSSIVLGHNFSSDETAPMEVMMIVHTKIHPNLVTAFGLQLGKSA